MSETQLETTFGDFELHRYPSRKRELLRAWDAADEYLLRYARDVVPGSRVLLCNDGFGALSVGLAHLQSVNWSDSWLAQEACRLNLLRNELPADQVDYLDSVAEPQGEFDLVLIKLPKSLALLDFQMQCLKRLLKSGGRVLLGGMLKNMPGSLWRRIERHYGAAITSRAVRKAKVIELNLNPALPEGPGVKPTVWTLAWQERDFEIFNHANVFSRDGLDIGTRFLLENMPETSGEVDIADLGCGNGVLGLVAAAMNPVARVRFFDESWMAVYSARRNVAQLAGAARRFGFTVGDGLTEAADTCFDRVLCNPPFHQQHSVADVIAKSMFYQARRCLRPGGELWVVGNRHLEYQRKLKRWFDSVECIASNRKFVILRGRRS